MNSEINNIYNICKHIADNKHSTEVNDLFVEELSELIKAVMKLERWNNDDRFLRCEYEDIIYNLYEEIGDVIVMLLQFVYKNEIDIQEILDKICIKLIRYYETISDKK